MGNIFRALRRRKAPSEELDKLVQQISELETQLKQLLDSRSWSLRWILYCALFLTTSSSAYFWLQHPTLKRKFLSISVVLSVGTFTYVALRFVTVTLHDWLIGRKQRRIRFFTERKVAIIEEVKENEKFNVAKDIIEKYGSQSEVREWLGPRAYLSQPSKALANGHKKPRMSLEAGTSSTEANGTMKTATTPVPKLYEIQRPSPHSMASSTHRAPIRPFVEESRTPIDRVLDLVMGESINNRYALICANCRSHNGMALREEFETISYYCFRCNFFNPSKAEMSRRNILYASPKMLDFTGNTDESTENEVESERKASTASLNSELSEREEEITPS